MILQDLDGWLGVKGKDGSTTDAVNDETILDKKLTYISPCIIADYRYHISIELNIIP